MASRHHGLLLLAAALWACSSAGPFEPVGGHGGADGTSSAVGSTGPGPSICAGWGSCGFSQFCDLPEGSCGEEGVCKPEPTVCAADCPGTCGCDGVQYCNACFAWRAGTDVDPAATCEPSPPVYQAIMLASEPRRLWLTKADLAHNLCIRIMLVEGEAPSKWPVDVTAPWVIERIAATNEALDCVLPPNLDMPLDPQGDAIEPDSASGELVLDGPTIPCSIGGDLSLVFTLVPWVDEQVFELATVQLVLCE